MSPPERSKLSLRMMPARSEVLGLAEDGVGWSLDEHNEALVNVDLRARLKVLRDDIVAGKLKVHDYMSDNSCPD